MPFSKTGYQWRAHNIAATLQKTDAKQNRGLNHEAVNARVVKAMNSEMEVEDSSDPIEELRIEIASLRLKLRAVMTYLACVRDGFAGDETLAGWCFPGRKRHVCRTRRPNGPDRP